MVNAVDFLLNRSDAFRRIVKLLIPSTACAEGPIGFELHDLQSRPFVGPDVEIGAKGLQSAGLGGFGSFPVFLAGGFSAAFIQTAVPTFYDPVIDRCIGD